MKKVTAIGGGYIQIGTRKWNLAAFESISKYKFGMDEDPDGNREWGIEVSLLASGKEDNEKSASSFFISTYLEGEEADIDADLATIDVELKNIKH